MSDISCFSTILMSLFVLFLSRICLTYWERQPPAPLWVHVSVGEESIKYNYTDEVIFACFCIREFLRLCLHCIGSVFVSFAKCYGPSVNSFRPRPSMPSYFLLYIIRIVSCCLPDSILSHALNRNCSDWCLHYNESVAKTDPIHRAPLRRANRRTTGSLQKLRR